MEDHLDQVCEIVNDLATTMASKFKSIEPRLDEITAHLDALGSQPQGRKSSPAGHTTVLGLAASGSPSSGFKSFGEYAQAVRTAGIRGGKTDERLFAAATTFGNEAVGTDGGFAVPPEFRASIEKKMHGQDALLSRCFTIATAGNSLTVPISEQTPWDDDGVRAVWSPEGGALTQSKPKIRQVNIKLHKVASFVAVTEELMEDAPAVGALVAAEAGEQLSYAVSDAIINGTGAGQPLGLLNAAATVDAAELTFDVGGTPTVQAADSIVAENVADMYSRLPAMSRRNAVWLVHPSAENQLYKMTLGDQPIYLPPGAFSSEPYARLWGLPVIVHEACQPVGDRGDIILADFSRYLAAIKNGGMRAEQSMHVFFDQDIHAFRFIMRVAGQPLWSEPTTSDRGAFTMSPFVTLAARDGS